MRHAGYRSSWRKGFIGICALNMMSDRKVYGNMIADELYQMSGQQWKPGPGAIYPALHNLVKGGYASSRKSEGKTVYTITRKGQRLLSDIREEASVHQRYGVDFGRMWLSILKPEDMAEHLLRRLKMNISTVQSVIEGKHFSLSREETENLLSQALAELRRGVGRLESALSSLRDSKRDTAETVISRNSEPG